MIIFYHLKNRSVKKILSEYQLQITENMNFLLVKTKNLFLIKKKKKYKVHYKNLKLYLKLGLKFYKSLCKEIQIKNSILKTLHQKRIFTIIILKINIVKKLNYLLILKD